MLKVLGYLALVLSIMLIPVFFAGIVKIIEEIQKWRKQRKNRN